MERVFKMILAFTGHRPQKLGGFKIPNPIYDSVCKQIWDRLDRSKPEMVISGMALGVDQWAAGICITKKIPFTAAVPFKGQENAWPDKSKFIYNHLLKFASKIEYVCEPGYAAWKMQKRNEWMVDHADALVAIWDGSEGGTKNCYDYAVKQNKPIFLINKW